MELDPTSSARWTLEFRKQWVRGKNVLLYGSVFDRFLVNGVYRGLNDFVPEFLRGVGYAVVVEYDPVDGFRCPTPAMQQLFHRLNPQSQAAADGATNTSGQSGTLRPAGAASSSTGPSRAGTPASSQPTNAAARDAPPASPTGLQRRGAAGAAKPPSPSGTSSPGSHAPDETPAAPARRAPPPPNDWEVALTTIRELMRQSEHPVAVIVHFSDYLASRAGQPNERRALMCLMKALHEAASTEISAGPLQGRKNILVLVAANLEGVPESLLRDNPFLELVEITRPRSEERMDFVRRRISSFHEGQEIGAAPNQVEGIALDFANLTDGFSWWDLDAVRRASIADAIPIANTKDLISYYKYGERDDPWEKLSADRIHEAQATLLSRVVGQDHAIEAIVRMIKAAKEGITMSGGSGKEGRPKGVFFFVGPTGVGKTELAKALTALIFSDESAFERFDMSEYAEQHAAEKLAGAPPGYVGYDEGGRLTNRVRERPFSLLLFDEIEKAHARVLDKFLQILEDGRLTDGKGRTTYFSQTVIIFTSNIGAASCNPRGSDGTLLSYDAVQSHFRHAVENHFRHTIGRPEIYSRLGENVLVFDVLRPEFVVKIFSKFMHLLGRSLWEKRRVRLVLPDESLQSMIVDLMQQRDHLAYGGRRIRALLEDLVEKPLNEWLFDHPNGGPQVAVTVREGQVHFAAA